MCCPKIVTIKVYRALRWPQSPSAPERQEPELSPHVVGVVGELTTKVGFGSKAPEENREGGSFGRDW